jgi:hypothetical protein
MIVKKDYICTQILRAYLQFDDTVDENTQSAEVNWEHFHIY